MGADIALHSVSKYIGGHSDVIMGVIVCNEEALFKNVYYSSLSFGGCPSPFDCYLALRGLKTLECRVKNHCKSALSIAKFLEEHPLVESVIFPGL
jgi:cystathionine beta-lyase/cystathionine gamma-synthase